jgi:hypothetical protein
MSRDTARSRLDEPYGSLADPGPAARCRGTGFTLKLDGESRVNRDAEIVVPRGGVSIHGRITA